MPPSTLIYAHRGANRQAPENLRSAFERSLHYAIDGMETDVQLSRDEVPVLWHDRFLNKLGLPDKRIDDFDYAELLKLNFAQHFPGAPAESLMKLEDYLAAYRSRCGLLIEIKNRDWEKEARHHLKMQQTLRMVGTPQQDNFLISSFNLDSLVYAHSIAPAFPLIYNFEPEQGLVEAQQVLREHAFLRGLCIEVSTLDRAMVDLLHGQQKLLAVYTCNSDEEISRALKLGVDILISDTPEKALHMRDA